MAEQESTHLATGRLVSISPLDGATLLEVETPSTETINATFQQAEQVQVVWAKRSMTHRINVLKRVYKLVESRLDDLALLVTKEMGKPLAESYQTDVQGVLSALQHAIRYGRKGLRTQTRWLHRGVLFGRAQQLRRVPHGVVTVISPWNYPLSTPAGAIVSALVAGNAVVFKPSELTPGCGEALAKCFHQALREAGDSEALVSLLQGRGDVGQALVSHPMNDHTFFTGSVRTGRLVQQTLLRTHKGCSLELGGSDPAIILPSADLDAASSAVLWGRFSNAGQTCAAIKRVYVHESVWAEFTEQLTAKCRQLVVGHPLEQAVHIGPMVSEAQAQQIDRQLRDALTQAEVQKPHGFNLSQPLKQATPFASEAYRLPTLVFNPPTDSLLLTEEVFGPVLPVLSFQDEKALVRRLNQSSYGLGASVFGQVSPAQALAEQIQAAHVAVNDLAVTHYALPQVPWFGWKASGNGAGNSGFRNGLEGLQEMTRLQVVSLPWARLFQKAPWLFTKSPSTHVNDARGLTRLLPAPWGWLSPLLLRIVFNNRSSTRL